VKLTGRAGVAAELDEEEVEEVEEVAEEEEEVEGAAGGGTQARWARASRHRWHRASAAPWLCTATTKDWPPGDTRSTFSLAERTAPPLDYVCRVVGRVVSCRVVS